MVRALWIKHLVPIQANEIECHSQVQHMGMNQQSSYMFKALKLQCSLQTPKKPELC